MPDTIEITPSWKHGHQEGGAQIIIPPKIMAAMGLKTGDHLKPTIEDKKLVLERVDTPARPEHGLRHNHIILDECCTDPDTFNKLFLQKKPEEK